MKILFNGWFSGFLDNTNPGLNVNFFLVLFKKIYNKDCYVGNFENSDILCEFDMLISSSSKVKHKKWLHTYLFSGESVLNRNKSHYTCVLWGERNNNNIVNIPLFIPYIYSNNFLDKLQNSETINKVPKNDICVIISNNKGLVRNKFLELLEKEIPVYYLGRYKNNIGGPLSYDYNTSEFTGS